MQNDSQPRWKIWIDTGGTFTDCIATAPDGEIRRAKVLSSSSLRGILGRDTGERTFVATCFMPLPASFLIGFEFRLLTRPQYSSRISDYNPELQLITLESPLPCDIASGEGFEVLAPCEAPVLAAALVTSAQSVSNLPPIDMRLATTRGTNALLTRSGVPVAFFVTKGFRDLIEIGDQSRTDLFALDIVKPAPLYKEVVEVQGRLASNGAVVHPLNLSALDGQISELAASGIRDAAVALMHSYINPTHEIQLAEYLLVHGFRSVTLSSQIAPFIKILPRAQTAVVNAYLTPIIGEYLNGVAGAISNGSLLVMSSAGGLSRADSFAAKDCLLSGPAGGVTGASYAGKLAGYSKVISFDMGGTSTDVARIEETLEYNFEHTVGDAHLVAPALALETVAAGGGSICSFDGISLTVGPHSAGAYPGPACYGAGGPLTLTDVNLLLGRLAPEMFEIPINIRDAELKAREIQDSVRNLTGKPIAFEDMLEGFLDIADEHTADAIRKVSVRKGYDPADYALVAFGGAGPQHACALAQRLGMLKVVIPSDAGLLSALGLGHAVIERFAQRQILKDYCDCEPHLRQTFNELANEARELLKDEGVESRDIVVCRQIAEMRFMGQESALSIECDSIDNLRDAFTKEYENIYGIRPVDRNVEIVSIRVVASTPRPIPEPAPSPDKTYLPGPFSYARTFIAGKWRQVPCHYRITLAAGALIEGPALIFEQHSATVVGEGWSCLTDNNGALILAIGDAVSTVGAIKRHESVELELFTNRFTAIVGEMGEMLRRTAISTNVKERLDFSCSLLDPQGELVANAPHIPVHLGAMGLCVREVCRTTQIGVGDTIITNHPAFGGSHLPDITLITPVYAGDKLLGYVANRAHHAEIGGIHPGSMSPAAASLQQEGVVIPPTYLVHNGIQCWDEIERVLTNSPWPTRSLVENLADIRAALAANIRGRTALLSLATTFGADRILHFMHLLKMKAERKIREALSKFKNGVYSACEYLDNGTPICVGITIENGEAVIDFTGTGPVIAGNLNATPAVVNSVIIYVLRLLIDEPLPLNEGLTKAVTVILPRCFLNPDFGTDPSDAPAVAGGNVETSQRIADTLLKALGIAACSQGTMNNFIFGDGSFSYYETICGGAGATPNANGASAVHTHMTNTRITDPEVIEFRYPIRLERFEIRESSGGSGMHRGGDGVIREFLFHKPVSLSFVTQHRTTAPYGLFGGGNGLKGSQKLLRASGETGQIAATESVDAGAGDRIIIETPGGGGFGCVRK